MAGRAKPVSLPKSRCCCHAHGWPTTSYWKAFARQHRGFPHGIVCFGSSETPARCTPILIPVDTVLLLVPRRRKTLYPHCSTRPPRAPRSILTGLGTHAAVEYVYEPFLDGVKTLLYDRSNTGCLDQSAAPRNACGGGESKQPPFACSRGACRDRNEVRDRYQTQCYVCLPR